MTRIASTPPRASARPAAAQAASYFPILPVICWIALWGSINAGPWDIKLEEISSGLIGAFNGVRATFPLIVLGIWVFEVLGRTSSRVRMPTTPEWLWLCYAVVCLIATVGIDSWFTFAYWGLAFLATLCCAEMYIVACDDELAGSASLNRLSWLVASVVLVIVVKAAGGHLAEQTSQGLSGYSVNVKMPQVAGMPMVRSTGISRFAAAIGLVAFGWMWRGKGRMRLISVVLFVGCCWLVWIMQGRGSTASFAAALGVMLVLLGGRARMLGFVGLSLMLALVGLGYISHGTVTHVWQFASRNDRHLVLMHGRLGIYHQVWDALWDSPIMGFGPQADHRILFVNAQNGVLYALLSGGLLGGGAWILGFAVALAYLARAILQPEIVPMRDSTLFVQIAGLMVFFALRTIPENTAALFSVDLMLQLPAMIYLGELMRGQDRPERDSESYLVMVRENSRAAKAANGFASIH